MASITTLTDAERETLNAAMEIIQRFTPKGATWMIHTQHRETVSKSVTYFDGSPLHTQHSNLWFHGCTFADQIAMGIEIEAKCAEGLAEARAKRIDQLNKELAALTSEPLPVEA